MKTTSWLLFAGLALASCGKTTKQAPAPGQADAGRADRKLVVAKIGDIPITVGQLEDELNRLHPSIRVRFSSPERRKELLKNMVRFEVLAREARGRGLDRDPEVIKRVKRAMIDVMMNDLRSSLVKMEEITDRDIEGHYNKHIDSYRQPPKVRASVILTKTRGEAVALLAKLRKKRGDVRYFAELAAKHSIDPATKVKRGDLGFFARDDKKVAKELREAVFAIDSMWTLGGPVETGQGWAVLLKTGAVAEVNKPLRMESDRIKNRLFNERRLKAVEAFVKKLQDRAKVEILEQNLSKVEVKDAPQPPSSMIPPAH